MRYSQGEHTDLDTLPVADSNTHRAKMRIGRSEDTPLALSLPTSSSAPPPPPPPPSSSTYRACSRGAGGGGARCSSSSSSSSSISSIRVILSFLLAIATIILVSPSHATPLGAPKQIILVDARVNGSRYSPERFITFANVTSSRKRATFGTFPSRGGNQKDTTSMASASMSTMAESVISNSFQNCPVSDELIAPCSCNASKREVFCRGIFDPALAGGADSGTYLKTAFTNFARLVPPAYKYFHSVYISMRGLKTLEKNVFADIRFNTVVLKSINLTYIDKDAFQGLENYAQSVYLYGTNLSQARPQYDFYRSIRTLASLQKVIINQHRLGDVPDNAFTLEIDPLTGQPIERELTEIQISNGVLHSIGTDAFHHLRNLANLGLTRNGLSAIHPYAFRMNSSSNMTLFIDLTDNPLTAESFKPTTFLGSRRPVKINFGLSGCSAQLQTLPENVFRPFLDEHPLNIVDVGRHCYHITCDCKMAWTLAQEYTFRVKNFRCVVGDGFVYYRDFIKSFGCYEKFMRGETINVTGADGQIEQFQINSNKIQTNETESSTRNDSTDIGHGVYNAKNTTTAIATMGTVLAGEDGNDFCQTKGCVSLGLEMSKYVNKSSDPCDSFFDYACQGWENAHLLEYLLRVFSNGGSEFDNFVKVRIKIEQNLERLLIDKAVVTTATIYTKSLSPLRAQHLKENSLSHNVATTNNSSSNSNDNNNNNNNNNATAATTTTGNATTTTDHDPSYLVPINPVVNTMDNYVNCINSLKGPNMEALNHILDDIGGWPLLTKQFNATEYNWAAIYPKIINNYNENIFIELDSAINENSTKHFMIKIGSFVVSRRKLLSVKLNRLENYATYILNTILHFGGKNHNNETLNEIWDMIKFEKRLAHLSKKNNGLDLMIERKLKTLGCIIDEVNWFQILKAAHDHHAGLSQNGTFEVGDTIATYNIHYLTELSRLLAKTDPRVIGNYIGWRVIESWGYLFGGNPFNEIQIHFYSTESKEGTKLMKKQCLDPIVNSLHYLLARIYLEKHLPAKSRDKARTVIDAVRQSFIEGMRTKNWIDSEGLIKKVNEVHVNIGYPDWILDNQELEKTYSVLNYTKSNDTSPLSLVKFYTTIHRIQMLHMMTGLGGRVNKTKIWDPLPLYVGASYDIVDNIISIPMGLLQQPFYEDNRPFYLNFASLGSFFGHELAHSVTPRYYEYDRLLPPWSDHYLKDYLNKAQCFVGYYTAYYDKSAEQHLDGTKTFEEDMSDLSGIQAAYRAYRNYAVNETTARLQDLHDFNPDMLFFLSFAQKWCRSNSRVQTRYKISKSVHSPEKYRVNGALSNFNAFGKAFKCPVGSPMNPGKKCESW